MFEGLEKFLAAGLRAKKGAGGHASRPDCNPRVGLEHEPHAQLDVTRRRPRRAGLAGDAAEVGTRRIHFNAAQVRVVDEVEGFRPHLQPAAPDSEKFLNIAKSHCISPGLMMMLRGALPNVPAAGARNAAVLKASVPGPADTAGSCRLMIADQIPRLADGDVANAGDVIARLHDATKPAVRRRAAAHERGTRYLPPAEQVLAAACSARARTASRRCSRS